MAVLSYIRAADWIWPSSGGGWMLALEQHIFYSIANKQEGCDRDDLSVNAYIILYLCHSSRAKRARGVCCLGTDSLFWAAVGFRTPRACIAFPRSRPRVQVCLLAQSAQIQPLGLSDFAQAMDHVKACPSNH